MERQANIEERPNSLPITPVNAGRSDDCQAMGSKEGRAWRHVRQPAPKIRR